MTQNKAPRKHKSLTFGNNKVVTPVGALVKAHFHAPEKSEYGERLSIGLAWGKAESYAGGDNAVAWSALFAEAVECAMVQWGIDRETATTQLKDGTIIPPIKESTDRDGFAIFPKFRSATPPPCFSRDEDGKPTQVDPTDIESTFNVGCKVSILGTLYATDMGGKSVRMYVSGVCREGDGEPMETDSPEDVQEGFAAFSAGSRGDELTQEDVDAIYGGGNR